MQWMTPRDEFSALWIETRMGRSKNWVVLRRPITCSFLAHSTRKDPSLNLSMLLRVPATAWNPFWMAKGDNLLRGRLTLADSTTRNLGQLAVVSRKLSFSESVSVSWLLSLNRLCLFLGAVLWLLMIHYTLSPHATESNKGTHPPQTLDAAHDKHTGSESDHSEQEKLYKEELGGR